MPSPTDVAAHPDPTDGVAIEAATGRALASIAAAAGLDALKAARLAHAGDKSPLALANRAIADLPKADKASAGQAIGKARRRVSDAVSAREAELIAERDARVLAEETVDVTLSYDRHPTGARHPISTVMAQIEDVFVAMGWEVAQGPELEAEWFNFDALNFPKDHPARAMQDSFYVAGNAATGQTAQTVTNHGTGLVLRTHTSPVQVRTMLDQRTADLRRLPGSGLPDR